MWKSPRRAALILEAIIDAQQTAYPQSESWIEKKNGQISYIEQNCAVCYGRVASSEAVRWATDKEFNFQETACIAAGDPYCRFLLNTTRPNQ